jgi:CRP-like cAMP-binding protein
MFVEKLRTTHEAAAFLAEHNSPVKTTSTLESLRTRGGGPAFRKLGRAVRYTEADLVAWLEEIMSRPLHSTSELV